MNNDYMFEDEDNIEKGSYDSGQYQYQYYDMEQPQARERIGMAVFSFVLGLLSLIFFITGINIIGAIISIILGIIFLASRKRKRGKGLAIAAIVTSVLGIFLCIISWIFIFGNADNIINLYNDTEGMEFFYDYYGISDDGKYQDFLEEHPILNNEPADDNIFENNELDMDDTL